MPISELGFDRLQQRITTGKAPGSVADIVSDLTDNIEIYEKALDKHISTPISQNQRDVLTGLVFEEGIDKVADSELIKNLNEQNFEKAADNILGFNTKEGRVSTFKTLSRQEDKRMFLEEDSFKGSPSVINVIKQAAASTGVSSDVLTRIAKAESGLRPNAKAKTSSATGLFQFIRSTWSQMVKKYGKETGIGIEDIKDPKANAVMGALFTRDNIKSLRSTLGREPTTREIYLAHFAGLGGARKVLKALQKNPKAAVSAGFTTAQIRANRSLLKGSLMDSFMRLTNKVAGE